MSSITEAARLVQSAVGVPVTLEAARNAFEVMLAETRVWQDPDSPLFAAFIMAACHAADGRDAILFAPSLPASLQPGQDEYHPASSTAEQAAAALASLCRVLAERLDAAASASRLDDREACLEAARYARITAGLLSGPQP